MRALLAERIRESNEQAAKKCCRCKNLKDIEEFLIDRQGGERRYTSICAACVATTKVKNREQGRKKCIKYRQSLRTQVINAYGGKCACCGEGEARFLTVDHINNDGAAQRRELSIKAGWVFYAWVVKENFPEYLQLLCFNCNCAKGFYGQCPHIKTAGKPFI